MRVEYFLIGAVLGAAVVWTLQRRPIGVFVDRVDPNATLIFGGGGHTTGSGA